MTEGEGSAVEVEQGKNMGAVRGVEEREADRRRAGTEKSHALEEVLRGLRGHPRNVSAKYHYDERGSRLFEEITELEEYYLTRTERALLDRWMPVWVAEDRPATLMELGAGSAEKSRVVLNAMVAEQCGHTYVPIDVSADFLAETAAALDDEYAALDIVPTVGDITAPLELPDDVPGPRWLAFLGSTLGNFDEAGATALLGRVARNLHDDDHFLLGIDLRPRPGKPTERIERAYDDSRGVTAAFSLNILAVLNDEFGSDFDLTAFSHRSGYNQALGRIETYLDARRATTVRFPGEAPLELEQGESIRTEISCKYDRTTVDRLFRHAGLIVERWVEDDEGLYALVLGRRANR